MSGRTRILYTSQTGAFIGGGQKSLRLFLERIDRNKYTPVLACPSRGDLTDSVSKLGIEILDIPNPPLRKCSIAALAACIRLLREKRIDLIHTDNPRLTLYFGLAAKIVRIPLVWHVRVSDSGSRLYDRFLLQLATKVIAVSNAAAERFRGMSGAAQKVSVIHNGTPPGDTPAGEIYAQIRGRLGIGEQEILVGSAGQLVPKKGFELLFEAASLLKERKLPVTVRYLIAGRGTNEYTVHLENRVRELGLENIVTFAGFRSDFAAFLAGLDLFVLASLYKEGLSRVLIEAMAAGLPVVAFNTGGNREVIVPGGNGMLLEKGSVEQLADAIEKLAVDGTLRKTMGAAGREQARKNFNSDDNAAKIQNIYAEILAQRSGPVGKTQTP